MGIKRIFTWLGIPVIPMSSLLVFLLVSSFTAFFFNSCADDDLSESPVPAMQVNYSCNITTINAALQQTDVPHLDCQPGYVLINGHQNASDVIGMGGLLIFHSAFEDTYYAFDLACPYCYDHTHKVQRIEMNDIFAAVCPQCESEFRGVQYGSPAASVGPANAENLPLRTYRAKRLNYNTVLVTP